MSRFFALTLSFVFTLALSFQAHAIQTAIVGVDKAIVYADVEMTSPIGYVRGGRQLKVGSQARRGGAILPIVVAGRIAYIRTQDVSVSNNPSALGSSPQGPKLREHQIALPMGEVEDDLKENNFLVLSLGQYQGGGDLSDLNEGFGLDDSALTSITAMFEHRPVIYDFSWDVGIGYYSMSNEAYDLQTLTLEGNIYYSLLKTGFIDFQAYGGFTLSGDIRLTSETLPREERGSMWGYQFGAAAKIAPRQKWGFVFKAGIQRFNPTNLGDLKTSFTEGGSVGKIQGPHLSAGIAYKF